MTERRSFHLALPPHDPNSQRIVQWLADQPSGADLSALLRLVIVAGLDHQALGTRLEQQHELLQRVAADLANLSRRGVQISAIDQPVPDPPAELEGADLGALDNLFSSFEEL